MAVVPQAVFDHSAASRRFRLEVNRQPAHKTRATACDRSRAERRLGDTQLRRKIARYRTPLELALAVAAISGVLVAAS